MILNSITNADIAGKRVLLRLDLNVPVQDGKITDLTRIDRCKDTIDYLMQHRACEVRILAHYGRPKGRPQDEFSLSFLAPILAERWGYDIAFERGDSRLILKENIRFDTGEESNDLAYARQLADGMDIYINDAFSVSHRAHASVEAVTKILPSFAGLSLEKEVRAIESALDNPARPVAAIIGGAKVSTKLDLIANLIPKMDMIVLAGGMANTFLAAQGHSVGKSLHEPDMLDTARDILKTAASQNCDFILPYDGLMAKEFKAGASYRSADTKNITDEEMMLDIGPQSINLIKEKLSRAKTVLWNGPLGAFEILPFDTGTKAIAQYIATRTQEGAVKSIGGGGDTVAALAAAGVLEDFSYISTAGGAFLEWLEGKELPGIAALKNQAPIEKSTLAE